METAPWSALAANPLAGHFIGAGGLPHRHGCLDHLANYLLPEAEKILLVMDIPVPRFPAQGAWQAVPFPYCVQVINPLSPTPTESCEPPEPASSRIHDIPLTERPREKLALLGPAALNNAELMALFISTGMKGRSAIDIGRDLLAKYGSMGALGGLPVAELAKERGLGLAKASKLAAAFELGTRVAREQINDHPIDTPERIYDAFAPQLRHLPQEHVMVAVVDARLRHSGSVLISVGTVNESNAHPREILRPVITRGAFGFILIHNHPSGDPSPSRADEKVTRRLVEASELMQVRFLDHLIIGKPSPGRLPYYSFREAGLVP